MLLRGKYDVLINVTWDCFDQTNFYISRINILILSKNKENVRATFKWAVGVQHILFFTITGNKFAIYNMEYRYMIKALNLENFE
jgi:hypothetical protein